MESNVMEPIAHGTRRTTDLCCWPDCFRAVEHPEVPLCEGHFHESGMAWMRDNIELFREVTEQLEEQVMFARVMERANARRALAERTVQPLVLDTRRIVYYIRIGEHVKIGTTTNLRERMVALRADGRDLLATEPGRYDVETLRHRQFADERIGRRENFAMSDRLMEHIRSLQRG